MWPSSIYIKMYITFECTDLVLLLKILLKQWNGVLTIFDFFLFCNLPYTIVLYITKWTIVWNITVNRYDYYCYFDGSYIFNHSFCSRIFNKMKVLITYFFFMVHLHVDVCHKNIVKSCWPKSEHLYRIAQYNEVKICFKIYRVSQTTHVRVFSWNQYVLQVQEKN